MTFEEKMERLSKIAALLEDDKLSLDKSLELYKEGITLAADCKKTIENAKLTVKNMNGEASNEQ